MRYLGFRIRLEGNENLNCNEIAESWVAVYCGNFSMFVGGYLIFAVIFEVFFKEFPLHLILKGGFVLNCYLNYVSVFPFNYP